MDAVPIFDRYYVSFSCSMGVHRDSRMPFILFLSYFWYKWLWCWVSYSRWFFWFFYGMEYMDVKSLLGRAWWSMSLWSYTLLSPYKLISHRTTILWMFQYLHQINFNASYTPPALIPNLRNATSHLGSSGSAPQLRQRCQVIPPPIEISLSYSPCPSPRR